MVHIAEVHLPGWRRFTDLTLTGLQADARLVVLAGPNGLGKSSIFDGFRSWQSRYLGYNWDPSYYQKTGSTAASGPHAVEIRFHEAFQDDATFAQSAFTFRTAYRMEADFQVQGVSVMPPMQQAPRISRMSDTDAAVSGNFQRILSNAVAELFGPERSRTVGEVQDEMLASTATAMRNIFGDLSVENISDPLQGGAFFFSKGSSRNWHYKNLSGGERAAFDLVLDMAVKIKAFPSAIYCIDEPETHLNTRVQGALLNELLNLLPPESQLWIATHSIGMMRAARDRLASHRDVAFLDLEGHDMDSPVTITPTQPDRKFWARALRVALDDLAGLVAPATVVLVEGRPRWEGKTKGNAEFDARCFRRIFEEEYPDTEFVSVGSAENVENDSLKMGITIPVIAPGTKVVRVVDRDDRSAQQVADLREEGVKVLIERDLENYLLSDEMITALCNSYEPDSAGEAIAKKVELLAASVARGNPSDDIKSVSGEFYVWIKKRLKLTQVGNTGPDFLRDEMTKYLRPGTQTYAALRSAVFD